MADILRRAFGYFALCLAAISMGAVFGSALGWWLINLGADWLLAFVVIFAVAGMCVWWDRDFVFGGQDDTQLF